ncbi:MAG: hypothetical protein K2X74_00455 [Acetobacteraceae bacterium]|nr:hypothetical protein [Acetobacteraceae bacterium]
MSIAKWAAPASAITLATTALNSLAAAAWSDQLTEHDNTTDRYLYGDFDLLLGADLTAAAGSPFVGLYLIPTLDGTNYPNPPSGTGAAPGSYFAGSFMANASAVFRRGVLRGVVLPPLKWRAKLFHSLHGSTAFASSGNVLTFRPYNEEVV